MGDMGEWDTQKMCDALASEVRATAAQRDAAYRERNRLVAALARTTLAHGGRAGVVREPPDETIDPQDDVWRTIVFVELPTGQASWHFHERDLDLIEDLPKYQGVWDGHTTDEKYARLAAWNGFVEPTWLKPKLKPGCICADYAAVTGCLHPDCPEHGERSR